MGVTKLRLARFGCRNRPFYRIVAIDSRKWRDAAPLEYVSAPPAHTTFHRPWHHPSGSHSTLYLFTASLSLYLSTHAHSSPWPLFFFFLPLRPR